MNGDVSDGPLAGIRVLDLTQGVAGPYCTKFFSDFGAEVLKVERPDGGDPARRLGPFPQDEPHHETSGLFLLLNTGKLSVTLDLKTDTGQQIVRRLAADVDLVVESFRPGALARLGLGDEVLAAVNPRATLVQISSFGQYGPYRDLEADDLLLYAMGGVLSVTGDPTREPLKLGVYAPLFLAGGMAATWTLGAYTAAKRNGRGERVDISIHDIMVSSMDRGGQNLVAYAYSGSLMMTREATMGTTRTNAIPGGTYGAQYPSSDGYVQMIARVNWWDRFCKTIGREDLIGDEHYTANLHDPHFMPEVEALIYPWLLSHTKQEAMEIAMANGLPAAAINNLAEVFRDPHLRARDFFVPLEHPYAGTLEYPGPQFRMHSTPGELRRAPLLGEHNSLVLGERLGYSQQDIVILRQRNVI